jgi:hypothetical protein
MPKSFFSLLTLETQMTTPKLVAVALVMCVATVGWSQTSPEDHAAHHPAEKSSATAPAAAAPDRKMSEWKNDMAATRGLLDRAEHAESLAERERLLDQHLAGMRKQLAALKSQQCEMDKMEGGGVGGERPNTSRPGMMDKDMKMGDGMKKDHMMMCHEMMKARMDAVVELLEQTWRREELRKRGAN